MRSILAVAVIVLFTACNGSNDTPTVDHSIEPPVVAAPANIPFTIVGNYPHDTKSYTEGLEFHNGKLYESGGDYKNSLLQFGNAKTGAIEKTFKMGTDEVFGEGITVLNGKLYQLTYTTHVVYVYDVKDITKVIKTFTWPYEGWGMTNNGKDLIIDIGDANLYFVDPETFKVKNVLAITDNKGPVPQINELEYVDGFIYANIWQTDTIIKINPESGKVVGTMNFAGVIKQYAPDYTPIAGDEVLNGIAYDSTSKTFFITGKRWPKIFEVKLN